jgi:hypothetical protein
VSVTNPPTDRVVIPESSRVSQRGSGHDIQRQSLSSLVKAGQQVLSDAELGELFGLAQALTTQQLSLDNVGVPAAQQRRSLVLDFEFRRVAPGWPALQQGTRPSRFVVKQMRPLEPSPRVNAELRAAPIPRDVLARARRIETRHCRGSGVELDVLTVLTEPSAQPDLGYSRQPLLAGLGVTVPKVLARVFTHLELKSARFEGAQFRAAELRPGFPFSLVELKPESAILVRADGSRLVERVQCETRVEHAEPREMLRSFLVSTR